MQRFREEHELFRQTVRRFVQDEIVPRVDEWEAARKIPRELFRRMGELGLLGVEYPAEHGGAEADFWMSVVLAEELARCRSGGVAFSVIVHTDMSSPWLARLGTVEQKSRYLPGVISGETVCALAITEPGAGSDMAALATRARRDGDQWVINGAKTFITNGVYGDLYFVAARTGDTGPRHRQLSQFLVEKGAPGLRVTNDLEKTGMWASDTAELTFEDVRVPTRTYWARRAGGSTSSPPAAAGAADGRRAMRIGIAAGDRGIRRRIWPSARPLAVHWRSCRRYGTGWPTSPPRSRQLASSPTTPPTSSPRGQSASPRSRCQAIRHGGREPCRLRRGTAPRRLRLHARDAGGTVCTGLPAVDDRLGHVRDHAGDHRQAAAGLTTVVPEESPTRDLGRVRAP